jgi:nicotinamide mononucleotide transporter
MGYIFAAVTTGQFVLQLTEQLQQTQLIEIVAVVFGMVSVILAGKNHVWLYPTGIVSTGLFIYIMARAGLYAESWLNVYYLIMSVYGWVRWNNHRESEDASAISRSNATDWLVTICIVIVGGAVLYLTLRGFTDSDVPAWDAIVSATAWAGMWLLAKHKVENWILLNISNALAIPLQLYKGIPFTAVLTLFLFIVAIFGYLRWRRLYKSTTTRKTTLV